MARIIHASWRLRNCDTGPTIERLHSFIAEQGYVRAGKHHEVYLSDPRRAAPEKMKTIIRQPVAAG
jgi:Uncharacterized conserved protein